MIKSLNIMNPTLEIYNIHDDSFCQFGKIIDNYDFSDYIKIMDNRPIPEKGNIYYLSDDELMSAESTKQLSRFRYGNMPIQAGYCNGNNSRLNALEYHKSHEIDIAVTDLILLLGDIRDIKDTTFSAAKIKAFYLPAYAACELYSTTLHFSPCKVSDQGFKSIIILPKGTNLPLKPLPTPAISEDKLLWMQNKWLIAHADSKQADSGAHAGIIGKNIEVRYK